METPDMCGCEFLATVRCYALKTTSTRKHGPKLSHDCHSGIFEGRFSDFRHGRVCEHLGVMLGLHTVWTLPVE